MICDNIKINDNGHIEFAERDTVDLAKKYGTPLYLMDEDKIRFNVRSYKSLMEKYFPAGSVPEFASKAFSVKRIYKIMAEEKIDIDVVSCGEIYTAYSAGFPMENCFFHGNNKTDSDIEFAMDKKVGFFVVDGMDEFEAVSRIAARKNINQNILLRITPGIDSHTHKKISTGSLDSKFGIPIRNGEALSAVGSILKSENINLCGFHCHVGSQVFDSFPFILAADIMLDFIKDVKDAFGIDTEMLNLGGGFGVRYVDSDPYLDLETSIKEITEKIVEKCKALSLKAPKILMEPGRSIVADAGMTLYTVGSVKEIPGFVNYVSVDGGMSDNPRFALYEAKYTVALASRANDKKDFSASVVGRCCESGDIIAENISMPKPERNDILAVFTTGAYNYSMASNYNRLPRPAVVMLKGGKDYIAVQRETLEDICRLDV